MKYLITGHNGFKGTWMSLLLKHLGHTVHGLSLPPEEDSLSQKVNLTEKIDSEFIGDIRDEELVEQVMLSNDFDFVVHLAAQSLVRESYRNPKYTFETNVIGTLNVLTASARLKYSPAILIVTTDKVYKNDGRQQGYKEDDCLGGRDPYSASKAMADILAQSWQESRPDLAIGIARAGNVIGGGDSSKERLVPDLIDAFSNGKPVELRYPAAVRPWQHVLDCLGGYLAILNRLKGTGGSPSIWNIGPEISNVKTVLELAGLVAELLDTSFSWSQGEINQMHEADFLLLDSTKARAELNWKEKFPYQKAVEATVRWHRDVSNGKPAVETTTRDIVTFLS